MVASLKALPTLYEKVVYDIGFLGNRSRAAINLVEVIAESFGLKENRWTRPRCSLILGSASSRRFAPDSPLEGDGFELSVPRERGHRFELSILLMSLKPSAF